MKGILFKEDMFKAVIEGRKTQTRRVIKSPSDFFSVNWRPSEPEKKWVRQADADGFESFLNKPVNPRYNVGETIYLKEPYVYRSKHDKVYYKFDYYQNNQLINGEPYAHDGWKNKLFMPESAARYVIKITDVKVERVQDISEEDSMAEGVESIEGLAGTFYRSYQRINAHAFTQAKFSFRTLWESINGKESWEKNPWVWVYHFELTT